MASTAIRTAKNPQKMSQSFLLSVVPPSGLANALRDVGWGGAFDAATQSAAPGA
jgi:hypothetical protein